MTTIADRDIELKEEVFHLFGRLIARSDPGRLEEWAALGLSVTQLRVMFILRAEPGLAAGALAERLAVTPSTLTRIMDRLARHGLIERIPDVEDRRRVVHELSESGRSLVGEMESRFRMRLDQVFEKLDSPALERVMFGLRDLTEAYDAVDREDAATGVK
jgi:DNA-binding MarR family transcriptional regulator